MSTIFRNFLSMWDYPRKGHSPFDAAIKFRLAKVLGMRGNVYERLGGRISEEDRRRYMEAAAEGAVSAAIKRTNQGVQCTLQSSHKQ